MNRVKTTLILGAISLVAVAGAIIADSYDLKRVCKVGDEATFQFNAEMMIGDIKISASGKNVEKVVKVDEEGLIHSESVQSEVKITTPDGETPMPGEDKSTIVYNPDRSVKEIKTEQDADPSSMRLAIVSTVIAPPKALADGESWTADLKANGDETFPCKGEYKIVGAEKVGEWDCVKITMTVKETEGPKPAECSGTVWLNRKDYTTVKEDFLIKNAPISMMPQPVDLTLKNERKK